MSINVFIKITSAAAILFGLGWLLAPEFMAVTYGLQPNEVSILTTRFLGLTHIGWGMASWLVSESSDWTALRGLVLGNALGQLIGVIVSVWYTVKRPFNAMGWSAVVIYGVFVLGAVYYVQSGRAAVKAA
jgi:hypothetical protein